MAKAGARARRGKKDAAPVEDEGLKPSVWAHQIKLADQRNERWEDRCKNIIKRFRNDRRTDDSGDFVDGSRMNVLWSNVQTLAPSIYGREPVPIAERRFLDKDVTGRVGAQILERAMRYEMGNCGFHDTAEQCLQDYLLPGRGVAWLRFNPVIGQPSSIADRGDDDPASVQGDSDVEAIDPGVEAENRDGEQETDQTPAEKLLSAGVTIDYVHWLDFKTSKARYWREVEWVSRTHYMSRDDLVADFGEEIGREVPLEMVPEKHDLGRSGGDIDKTSDEMKKAIVHEIWDKPTRKVYFIAKGYDDYLEDPRDDPLNLEEFFPCPKPLFATMTTDTMEPVPDYWEYKDQARQIDDLTNRISLLTKALKVAGVYDASNKELGRLLDEGNENKLIPVQNWAALTSKGGLDNAISFVPVKDIAEVLAGLVEARDKVKDDMFEITGLSDIIRGQADPRETAEAVSTKGRWGSLRLQARQMAMARFCRDILRMMGEIISEHYPPELLVQISGAMFDEGIGEPAPEPPPKPDPQASPMLGHNGGPPMGAPGMAPQGVPQGAPPAIVSHGMPPPNAPAGVPPQGMMPGGPPPPPSPQLQYAMAMQQYQIALAQHQAEKQALIARAIDLLKQDKLRGFRIDIETDSTVQTDANEEKASRVEFIKATTQFIEQAFQIGAQVPDAAPMLGKMLLFGVRGFRAGRDLESTIEEFVDKMEKDAVAKKNSPPQPNPEMQKAQLELQATQAKSQAEIQKAQIDSQSSAQDNQRAIEQKQLDAQLNGQKMQMQMEQLRQEMEMKQAEFAMRMREMQMQIELSNREHANKLAVSEREHQHKREQMDVSHSHALEVIKAKPEKREAA